MLLLMDKYWKYLRVKLPTSQQKNRSEEHGAHCGEGLGSSRYGAKNALQNDDLRAIGYCWDPKLFQFEGPPASRAWNTELATPFLHWFLILSQAARKVPI